MQRIKRSRGRPKGSIKKGAVLHDCPGGKCVQEVRDLAAALAQCITCQGLANSDDPEHKPPGRPVGE